MLVVTVSEIRDIPASPPVLCMNRYMGAGLETRSKAGALPCDEGGRRRARVPFWVALAIIGVSVGIEHVVLPPALNLLSS